MLNLLHVGLGSLGRPIVSDLYRRGLGRVVAAVDPSTDLVGRPLAEVVDVGTGIDPGVTIVASTEEIRDWSSVRCALVTTSSDLELCMDTFRALLSRGVAVISTCEELSWPWLRHPIFAQELHELCIRHGGRILGAGVNPGFLMDALPVAASTLMERVARVRVERVQDATPRRIPFQRKIGATLALDEFARRVEDGTLRHVGLGESLHFIAHALGMTLESWDETIEPIVAKQAVECGLGRVEPGHARGVRQIAHGTVDGTKAIELVFHAAVGEPDPCDRIVLEGDTKLELVLPGGVHGDTATSALVLNSIRSLLEAQPGLHTMATIPLRGCAPPDDFSSR